MSSYIEQVVDAEQGGYGRLISKRWRELLAGEFKAPGYPLNATTGAYANTLVVKAGPALLFGLSGFNSKLSAQWIQIFDSSTVPANGAVPDVIITVPTVANFSADWIFPGRFFNQGIVVCNSSTGPTLTLGSADCWIDAQYL